MSNNAFGSTSRYADVATATLETASDKVITYLRRRFVPPPDRFALLVEHSVSDSDRLDLIAAHYLGDPEQFWRICDANGVLRPGDLEVAGQTVRITLPDGVPGTDHA